MGAVLVPLLAACSGTGPAITFDRRTDFSSLNSYSWMVTGALQDLDNAGIAEVRTRVERELAAKGFQPVAGGADFIVSLSISQLAYVRPIAPRYAARPSTAFRDSPLEGTQEAVITVAVSMADGTTRRALWRGSLSRALGPAAPAEVAAGMVPGILAFFPPET